MRWSTLQVDHKPMKGDIVLTRARSLIGRLIRRFQTSKSDTTKTVFNHVGIMKNSTDIIEAVHRVRVNDLERKYSKKKEDILIARFSRLTTQERIAVRNKANYYVGKKYGYFKIGFHYLDYLLGRMRGRDVFFFRKIPHSHKYPICSWLAAWAYNAVGISFKGLKREYCQPDDIADEILIINKANWRIIFYTDGIKYLFN